MKKTPYLTQYCNLKFEWQSNGITPDNATENQINEVLELQEKAIEQSGLTCNELVLIALCRKHRIFKKVNVYARKLVDFEL